VGAGAFGAAAAPPSFLACPGSTLAVLAAVLPAAVPVFHKPELVSFGFFISHQHHTRGPTPRPQDMDIDALVPIARSPQQTQDQQPMQDKYQGGQNMADYDTNDYRLPGPDRNHPPAPNDNHRPTANLNHPPAPPPHRACLRDGGFEDTTAGNNSAVRLSAAAVRSAAEPSDNDDAGHAEDEEPQRGTPPSENNGGAGTRGVSWTRDEREVLCAAFVEATLNAEVGTYQRMEVFKSDYCNRFREHLPDSMPQVARRRGRSTSAIDKELKYNIFPMVERFKNAYVSVLNAKMTGNPTPEDLVNAAVAKFKGLSPYEDFNAEYVATLMCAPLPYWEILRKLDQFSGAATIAAIGGSRGASAARGAMGAAHCDEDPLHDLFDDEDDNGDLANDPTSSTYARGQQQLKRRSWSAFQARPQGNKAAKASSRMESTFQRESITNAAALNSIARSTAEQATIACWSSPTAADAPEGRLWWHREMRRRLKEDENGQPTDNANMPDAQEEAEMQDQVDAAAAAVAAALPPSRQGGARGGGRGGMRSGDRGRGRGRGRGGGCARGSVNGRGYGLGRTRGRGSRLQEARRGGRSSSSEEESVSDADAANAFNPPGSENAAEDAAPSAQRKPSPPPSAIALAPASSIEEAATAAAALIASHWSGDSGLSDDADKEEEAGDTQDTHAGPAGTEKPGSRELSGSSRVTPQGVSGSRPPLPPHHRAAMSRGSASLLTKRRRFKDLARRGGIDLDARIIESIDWDTETEDEESADEEEH